MLGATEISHEYFNWRKKRQIPTCSSLQINFDLSDASTGIAGNYVGSPTYRMAPGSTVTSAAEIAVATVNERESTILTLPPLSWVASICESGNANELGIKPAGLTGRDELPSAGGASKTKGVIDETKMTTMRTYCWGKCRAPSKECGRKRKDHCV